MAKLLNVNFDVLNIFFYVCKKLFGKCNAFPISYRFPVAPRGYSALQQQGQYFSSVKINEGKKKRAGQRGKKRRRERVERLGTYI